MPDLTRRDSRLLEVAGLSVDYGGLRALREVSVAVDQGEVVSIIGANGAGKTSLIKAIMGRVRRSQGSIRFDGREIADTATPDIVASGIALVPEGRRLFPGLTVEENLRIGLAVGRGRVATLDPAYAAFPVLFDKRRQPAERLSGGQQQMVAIGRALLAGPRIMLCDEISLGLAPVVIAQMYASLAALKAAGIGILVVEQDIQRSLTVADRFYCLLEGRVTLEGRPADHARSAILDSYFGVQGAA